MQIEVLNKVDFTEVSDGKIVMAGNKKQVMEYIDMLAGEERENQMVDSNDRYDENGLPSME